MRNQTIFNLETIEPRKRSQIQSAYFSKRESLINYK